MANIFTSAETWFASIQGTLNTVVIALVILFAGIILGRIMDRLLYTALLSIKYDERMTKIFSAKRRYARSTRRTIVRIIYLVTVLLSLRQLDLDMIAIAIIIGIVLTVLLISTVLAGLDVIPNLLAWWRLKGILSIGDEVEVSGATGVVSGKVTDISLFEVRIKRKNGDILHIPLAAFLDDRVTRKQVRSARE